MTDRNCLTKVLITENTKGYTNQTENFVAAVNIALFADEPGKYLYKFPHKDHWIFL